MTTDEMYLACPAETLLTQARKLAVELGQAAPGSVTCRQRCGMDTNVLHGYGFHPPTQTRPVHAALSTHMARKTAVFLYAA